MSSELPTARFLINMEESRPILRYVRCVSLNKKSEEEDDDDRMTRLTLSPPTIRPQSTWAVSGLLFDM